jgi:hypothetical protein
MIWLIVGLVLFLGVHSVRIVAPEFRQSQIEARGLECLEGHLCDCVDPWFHDSGLGLWPGPPGSGGVLGRAGLDEPCGRAADALRHDFPGGVPGPGRRIKAAVKHPMLLAVKIWALAHLLVNGDLASVLLFGGFLAWAVVDRISEKNACRQA